MKIEIIPLFIYLNYSSATCPLLLEIHIQKLGSPPRNVARWYISGNQSTAKTLRWILSLRLPAKRIQGYGSQTSTRVPGTPRILNAMWCCLLLERIRRNVFGDE